MTKLIFTTLLSCIILSFSNAQEINFQKKGGGYLYTQNDQELKPKDMAQLMKDYPQAHKMLQASRTQNTVSILFAGSGGWFLGGAIGKGISGNHTDALIDEIGIGAGLVGISFIIRSIARKNTHNAVNSYNASVTPDAKSNTKPSLKITTTENGVGLRFNF